MGLDTYAVYPVKKDDGWSVVEDEDFNKEDPDGFINSLCGGMFSGGGASFRGKAYSDLIYEITGHSLYEEYIPPATVKEMAEKLLAREYDDYIHDDFYVSPPEYVGLQTWFKICSDHGYAVHGWW